MKLVLALVLVGLVILVMLNTFLNRDSPSRREVAKTPKKNSPILPLPPHSPLDIYTGGRPPSKGERECRRVLERIYMVRFPTVRPAWLTSTETNAKLEIDCYAEVPIEVNGTTLIIPIGCEYQGEQHYRVIDTFQDERAHNAQKWNDEYKKRLCTLHGVHLIEVPYTIKLQNIEEYIKKELSIRNILPEQLH